MMEDIYRAIGYTTARQQVRESAHGLAQIVAGSLPDEVKSFVTQHPFLSFAATVAATILASRSLPRGTSSETKRLAQLGPAAFSAELRRLVK
jgi:hypothetical protein